MMHRFIGATRVHEQTSYLRLSLIIIMTLIDRCLVLFALGKKPHGLHVSKLIQIAYDSYDFSQAVFNRS